MLQDIERGTSVSKKQKNLEPSSTRPPVSQMSECTSLNDISGCARAVQEKQSSNPDTLY